MAGAADQSGAVGEREVSEWQIASGLLALHNIALALGKIAACIVYAAIVRGVMNR